MRFPIALGTCVACICLWGIVGRGAAPCDPIGTVQFICGVANAEDLVAVPQSDWVVASGVRAPGALYVVNSRDKKTVVVVLPTDTLQARFDKKTYDSCPGPLNVAAEKERFRAHGVNLTPGRNRVHTLYLVHHGNREAIEVFDIDGRGKVPTLTWIGCSIAPTGVTFNSVAALPDGGIVATQFTSSPDAMTVKLPRGENTGAVWEWHTGTGWTKVPGSDRISGPNGLEVSKDGKWYYIGAWGGEKFVRLSRGQTPVRMDGVSVGFHIDNLRWAPDGTILAAGPSGTATAWIVDCVMERKCAGSPAEIAKVDPETLKVVKLVSFLSHLDVFVGGTVALQVGKEIWGGQMSGDRIARFPLN